MKLWGACPAQVKGRRLGARTGFTLVEAMVASTIMVMVLAGAITFINFASVSVSGITAQNTTSVQAGGAIALIQNRMRLATSVSNSPSGNTLILGFDDNYKQDADGDGTAYNDKDHFEQFRFVGLNSTNPAACSGNSLVYDSNVAGTTMRVLVPRGVRNLPLYDIFSVTNLTTAVIRFGVVDSYSRDYFQGVDIQATAVSLNRPATTNLVGILP